MPDDRLCVSSQLNLKMTAGTFPRFGGFSFSLAVPYLPAVTHGSPTFGGVVRNGRLGLGPPLAPARSFPHEASRPSNGPSGLHPPARNLALNKVPVSASTCSLLPSALLSLAATGFTLHQRSTANHGALMRPGWGPGGPGLSPCAAAAPHAREPRWEALNAMGHRAST